MNRGFQRDTVPRPAGARNPQINDHNPVHASWTNFSSWLDTEIDSFRDDDSPSRSSYTTRTPRRSAGRTDRSSPSGRAPRGPAGARSPSGRRLEQEADDSVQSGVSVYFPPIIEDLVGPRPNYSLDLVHGGDDSEDAPSPRSPAPRKAPSSRRGRGQVTFAETSFDAADALPLSPEDRQRRARRQGAGRLATLADAKELRKRAGNARGNNSDLDLSMLKVGLPSDREDKTAEGGGGTGDRGRGPRRGDGGRVVSWDNSSLMRAESSLLRTQGESSLQRGASNQSSQAFLFMPELGDIPPKPSSSTGRAGKAQSPPSRPVFGSSSSGAQRGPRPWLSDVVKSASLDDLHGKLLSPGDWSKNVLHHAPADGHSNTEKQKQQSSSSFVVEDHFPPRPAPLSGSSEAIAKMEIPALSSEQSEVLGGGSLLRSSSSSDHSGATSSAGLLLKTSIGSLLGANKRSMVASRKADQSENKIKVVQNVGERFLGGSSSSSAGFGGVLSPIVDTVVHQAGAGALAGGGAEDPMEGRNRGMLAKLQTQKKKMMAAGKILAKSPAWGAWQKSKQTGWLCVVVFTKLKFQYTNILQ